jgi:peptidoglycan/xylan/chitin deacetylase (PgdA/CDA1 family)
VPLPLILCYHKIERREELGVTRLSPRRFARQVERLARDGWRTLTLAELLATVNGTRALGRRELAITFDDAYRGLRDNAFPVLRAHGYTAITAVITDYAGKLNRWDVAYGGRRFAHLAWRDMRRWQSQGFEFIPHTTTHPRLTWLDESSLRRELASSRRDLERALNCDPRVISYPFGAAREREFRVAREEGFVAGLTLATRWQADVMAIPRLPVYRWSPRRPGVGVLAPVERLVAVAANRCAVGTTLWQSLRGAPRPSTEVAAVG